MAFGEYRVCLLKLLEILVKGRPSRRKEIKESEGMRGEREKIDKKLARKKEREREREKKREKEKMGLSPFVFGCALCLCVYILRARASAVFMAVI